MIKPIVRIMARLLVNGEDVPIKSFTYTAAPQELGASLTIILANPGYLISEEATITFSIGVHKNFVEAWVDFLKDGNLTGRRATIRFQGDTLEVSAVNALADRWQIRPEVPIVLYDVDKISFAEVSDSSINDVIDYRGKVIRYKTIGRRSLDLRQVLSYAYVTGCGFSKVITNIPNYPIRRVDFAINSSWHDVAKKYTALYNPVYFADDNDTLYILDIEGNLPADYAAAARSIKGANVVTLNVTQPIPLPIDSVLLTYQEDLLNNDTANFPATATDRITEVGATNGAPFAEGYYNQIVTTHYKDFHDDANEPDRVTRSVPWKVVTQNYAGAVNTGLPLMISRETVTDFWLFNWYVKGGYDKVVEARVPLPFGTRDLILREVKRETNRIKWAHSLYNSEELLKVRDDTEISGEVIVEGTITGETDATTDWSYTSYNVTAAVPVMEAYNNRQITQDGFQVQKNAKIGATLRYYRDTGTSQVDGIETKIDYLAPSTESSKIDQNIGTRAINLNKLLSRTMLITIYDVTNTQAPEGTVWGVPLALSAGEVPLNLALEVVRRRLIRKSARRIGENVGIDYPYLDFALRRGSVRRVEDARGIAEPTLYLTLGFTIQGNLTGNAPGIRQSSTAVIVTSE